MHWYNFLMNIHILTLFPDMFSGPFDWSILKRAKEKGIIDIKIHNLRDWSQDKYKSVDDRPYGGGAGMVMRVDILDRAISQIKAECKGTLKIIITDAGGERFNQGKAKQLSTTDNLIIVCGHYEGIDHRVHEELANEVISIGDYVLSGGEIPAMVITDCVARLIPGALGNEQSLSEESHNNEDSVEYPQYTRPEEYRGWKVPGVLLSGNHKDINEWRKKRNARYKEVSN